MSEQAHGSAEPGHGGHSTNYVKVWAVLLVLLVISVMGPFVGEAMSMQWITLVTAFGIALVKAFLVIKHFMHITIERRVAHFILVSALICVALFFAGVAGDVMNHEGRNWRNDAAKAVVEAGQADPGHGDTAPKKGH